MTTKSAPRLFTVRSEFLDEIEAKLEKLAKKAGKLGIKVPSLRVVKEYVKQVDKIDVLYADIEVDCEVIRNQSIPC